MKAIETSGNIKGGGLSSQPHTHYVQRCRSMVVFPFPDQLAGCIVVMTKNELCGKCFL